MRLPIKSKIALAALITVALVVGLIGFVVRAQRELADLMDVMIRRNMAAMRLAEAIKYDFVLSDDLIFRSLLTGDPLLLSESQRLRDKVHDTVRRMKELALGLTEEELLTEIEGETSRYELDVKRLLDTYTFKTEEQKKNVVNLIKSIESGAGTTTAPIRQTQQQTLALLSAEGRARLTRIYSQCEKLVDISRAKLEEAQARVQGTVQETRRAALLAGSTVAGASLLVSFLLALSLLGPLKTL
jgi:hypothetical protein